MPKRTIIGTLQTRRGERYAAPGMLPAPNTRYAPLDELLNQYAAEIAEYKKDEASVERYKQLIEQAKEEHPQLAYEARVKGEKEPTDPVPALTKKLEAADKRLDISEYAVLQTSKRITDMRENDPELRLVAEDIADVTRGYIGGVLLPKLQDHMDQLGEALYLQTWLAGPQPSRVVPGRTELAAFNRQMLKLADKQPVVYVSPKAMQQLLTGEAVETVDGETLTFDRADNLKKRGKLKVSYGRPRRVDRPERV
jgi:hypothetical protein